MLLAFLSNLLWNIKDRLVSVNQELRIFRNNWNFDFILDHPKYIYFTIDGSLYNYDSVFYGIILP